MQHKGVLFEVVNSIERFVVTGVLQNISLSTKLKIFFSSIFFCASEGPTNWKPLVKKSLINQSGR